MRSALVMLGQYFCTCLRYPPLNSEFFISIRPGRKFFASTLRMPGVVRVWNRSPGLTSVLR
ncbi:hypothetical protein D3C80_2189310 [compost metagenome]